jgi:hypothetical protein
MSGLNALTCNVIGKWEAFASLGGRHRNTEYCSFVSSFPPTLSCNPRLGQLEECILCCCIADNHVILPQDLAPVMFRIVSLLVDYFAPLLYASKFFEAFQSLIDRDIAWYSPQSPPMPTKSSRYIAPRRVMASLSTYLSSCWWHPF